MFETMLSSMENKLILIFDINYSFSFVVPINTRNIVIVFAYEMVIRTTASL